MKKKANPKGSPFVEKMKAAKAKKKAVLEEPSSMTTLTASKLRATLEAVRANPKL